MRLGALAECRSCHDPIRFVQHDKTQRAIPVNPRPGREGNVVAQLVGGRLIGYVVSADRPASLTHPLRFVPHFATCPERGHGDPAEQAAPKSPAPEPDPALF